MKIDRTIGGAALVVALIACGGKTEDAVHGSGDSGGKRAIGGGKADASILYDGASTAASGGTGGAVVSALDGTGGAAVAPASGGASTTGGSSATAGAGGNATTSTTNDAQAKTLVREPPPGVTVVPGPAPPPPVQAPTPLDYSGYPSGHLPDGRSAQCASCSSKFGSAVPAFCCSCCTDGESCFQSDRLQGPPAAACSFGQPPTFESPPSECRPRPTECTDDCPIVCGCDGLLYCSACVANAWGHDITWDSFCARRPAP